jgi:hypothetical protein
VNVIVLNEYFKNNINIDFIKIDVEGAEILVLNGMKNIISNNMNLKIMIEYSPKTPEIDSSINMEFLSKYRFIFSDIVKNENNFLNYSELKKCIKTQKKW